MLASISSQHAESDSRSQGNPSRFRQVEIRSNKPMLSDPDKIYPGQVLRIPELSET